MKIKTNIYTSYYAKMLKRHKVEGRDFYIQVSRSLFLPAVGVDGKPMIELIDYNYGPTFGMYSASLKEYEKDIRGSEYNEFFDELKDILIGKTFYQEYSDEDIASLNEVIEELKQWKNEVKDLTVEERIQNYNESYPEQDDKDSISFFGLTEDCLGKGFEKWEPAVTFNFFLLCFENLESRYTEKDAQKYSNVKVGELKKCHRTILAKVLKEKYKLNICEYKEKEVTQGQLF